MRTTKREIAHEQHAESSLADRLRKAMSLKGGINPNRIQTDTGITRQAVYAMLDGKTQNPLRQTIVTLAAYLGVRAEWLADGEHPMYPAPILQDEEVQLIQDYRELSPGHQRDLREIAHRWAEEDADHPSKGHPFRRIPKQ